MEVRSKSEGFACDDMGSEHDVSHGGRLGG